MTQDAFAGKHTKEKLEALERYLAAYITVLKKQRFRLIYFDAFAGTGSIPIPNDNAKSLLPSNDSDYIVKGSVDIALKFPFAEFHFVEKQKKKFLELKEFCSRFHSDKKIVIKNCDANDALKEFADQFDPRTMRASIFLDPFGNQVPMETFRHLARKPGLDIWYLFPAGLGVNRQIGQSGKVHEQHEKSLDELFGDKDWRQELITETSQPDLFEGTFTSTSKNAGPDRITKLMIARLKNIFDERVVDDWLQLGPGNHHWYSLLFMWSNPVAKAKLADKLAKEVLKTTKRNRKR